MSNTEPLIEVRDDFGGKSTARNVFYCEVETLEQNSPADNNRYLTTFYPKEVSMVGFSYEFFTT